MTEFINLTNHPSSLWNEKQKKAAEAYGHIVDIPFPAVNCDWSDEDLDQVVSRYKEQICSRLHPVVLLQGDFVFTYRLISLLKKENILVLAACSQRHAVERITEDGRTEKVCQFDFVRFREY